MKWPFLIQVVPQMEVQGYCLAIWSSLNLLRMWPRFQHPICVIMRLCALLGALEKEYMWQTSDRKDNSPGKLAIFNLNPKQIATQMFFAFLVRLYIQIWHIKSRTKSGDMKFDFFLVFAGTNFHFHHILIACNNLIVSIIVVCFIS